MAFKCWLVSILLTALVVEVEAQSEKYDKNEKKIYKDAESFYIYGDYHSTIQLFKQIEKADTSFKEVMYKIGKSYYQLKHYDSARTYLERGSTYNKDALFYLSSIELYFENIEKSRSYLNLYLKERDDKSTEIKQLMIDNLQNNFKVAEELMMEPDIVNIINLGAEINSENAEYVPLISSDETFLAFTSRRIRDDNGVAPTGKPFEDVYTSQRSSLKEPWSEAEPIKGKINTDKHDACVGLSPDGRRLFIYRSHENLVGGDLFESTLKDGSWTVPVKMSDNINNTYSIEPSASLSLDGRTFYFSSNREGGLGGFDIYRVVLLPNGKWSLPKNLGNTINTPYDDDAPFIHPDGKTLYFSSKGHKNMGGFDIFKSELKDEKWSEPENMGYPTNTTKDDIYFTISANEQHGYYASDKEGGYGKHDIYLIDYLEKSLRQSVVRGIVKDSVTGEKIAADISVIELESAEFSGVYVANRDDGKFIFLVNPNIEYEILVEAEGYEERSEIIFYTTEDLKETQSMEFKMQPIDQ